MQSRPRRHWGKALSLIAFAYPLSLAALALAMQFIGESWWVTTALLYLPRILFGVPLPFVVLALLLGRMRKLLWTQLVAGVLLIFPLMGFVLPFPGAASTPDARSFRLLSLNADSGNFGQAAIAARIISANPDVVLIQEGPFGGQKLSAELHSAYPYVQASTQFIIASRFPILQTTDPDRVAYYGRQRSARFMRYLLQTPLGVIAFYSVHPISPRGALNIHHFRDALHTLRTGAFLAGDPEANLGANTGLRALQVATAAELATREGTAVVIAGDTNLPGLSSILRSHLSRFNDAFREASWGFGFTFPAKRPFLRLDRILSGPELEFKSFGVSCAGISDHLCVWAEIERRK